MIDGFTELNVEAAKKQDTQSSDVKVIRVPLEKIVPNPYQPRKEFEQEALEELSDSIKQYGVLQPLLVAPDAGGSYMLIAGERRLRASKMAGLTEVPVIVSEYTPQQIAEIAMIENLQRKDLHYMEEARGYEKLMNTFGMTQQIMAARVGKKQSTIANKLRILKLPQDVQQTLVEKELSERHARSLLKLSSEEDQRAVLKKIIRGNLNVRQTEALVDKTLKDAGQLQKKKRRIVIVKDVRIYLNSIKRILESVSAAGIPASMETEVEEGDVLVTIRIKNAKKNKAAGQIKLF